MLRRKTDILQGTLALLVLKTLEHSPMHGWGITLHIQRISNEVLRVEEGSLYPALHRMEQEGWITAEWAASENNRRARYYRLTAKGRRQLLLIWLIQQTPIGSVEECPDRRFLKRCGSFRTSLPPRKPVKSTSRPVAGPMASSVPDADIGKRTNC